MDPGLLATTITVLVLGAALQSAAGFGFGMFAIPLLILMGAQPYEAIVIVVICGSLQTVVGIFTLRTHVHWRLLAGMLAVSAATLPAGVWAQEQVTSLATGTIRQIFGAIVLASVLVQWVWRVEPRDHLHWGWCIVAMILCGFLGGFCGMAGPPVVIWIMAQRWSNPRSRVTLWALFTGLMPLQIFFIHRRFGPDVTDAIVRGLTYCPVVLVGMIPGLWIGHRLARRHLRLISYAILILISLYAIVEPMLG